jgi:hypothetical protein
MNVNNRNSYWIIEHYKVEGLANSVLKNTNIFYIDYPEIRIHIVIHNLDIIQIDR